MELTSDHDSNVQNGYIKFDLKPKNKDTCIFYIKNSSKSETINLKCCELVKNLPNGIVTLHDQQGKLNFVTKKRNKYAILPGILF